MAGGTIMALLALLMAGVFASGDAAAVVAGKGLRDPRLSADARLAVVVSVSLLYLFDFIQNSESVASTTCRCTQFYLLPVPGQLPTLA